MIPARRVVTSQVGRRMMSTSPKVALAQHLVLLREVSGAKTEAEIKKILSAALPNVNINKLPEELSTLTPYFSLGAAASSEKFIPDPTAWQNKAFFAAAQDEAQRSETWPFLVGFLAVGLLFGAGLTYGLPEAAHKSSKYARLLAEKRGEVSHHGNDHHGHH